MKYLYIKFILSAFLLFPFTLPAFAADTLNKTTDQIIENLSEKIRISGITIQVSENNFLERESMVNLPFSKALRDSLAASLSKYGAVVTVSEHGERPLILNGSYGFEGENLFLTIRIRRMGDLSSEDIAVARAEMPRKKLDESLFKPDFKRVANSLISMLERNYTGPETFDVKVKALRPGVKGEQSVLLGSEMKKYLSTAVNKSNIFGESFNRSPETQFFIQGTYTRLGDYMRLFVEVVDYRERQMTSASYNVKITDIPPELLNVGTGEEVQVCIVYTQEAYNDIKADSPAVGYLIGKIGSSIGKSGFKSRVCESGDSGSISIKASMNTKETGGGDYEFLSGNLILHINSKDGNSLGTLEYKGRSVIRNDPDRAINRVIDNIFKKNNVSEDLKGIILSDI